MRLLITAAVAVSGRAADLCLDLAEEATVVDISRSIADHFGLHPGVHLDIAGTRFRVDRRRSHGPLGVVSTLGDTGPGESAAVLDGNRTASSYGSGADQRVHSPGGVIGIAAGGRGPSGPFHPARIDSDEQRSCRSSEGRNDISLWLGERELDPDEPVATCPIRNGDIIGIGGPVPDALNEPDGIVEIRVASGPDAGRVMRLTAGEYSIGAAPDCALPLRDPTLPPTCLWVIVNPQGEVTIEPDPHASQMTRPPSTHERSGLGPIVTMAIREEPEGDTFARIGAAAVRRAIQRAKNQSVPQQVNTRRLLIDPSGDRPLIHLDRAPVEIPVRWCSGIPLVVGDSMLELAVPGNDEPVPVTAPRRGVSFFERPRRAPIPCYNTRFRMSDGLGENVTDGEQGLSARGDTTAPQAKTGRRRKGFERQHREMLRAQIEERVYRALAVERLARRQALPDPGAVLVATGTRTRLWERRPDDSDWLMVRVGTADLDSAVELRVMTRETPAHTMNWTVPDVPVGFSLKEAGTVGFHGPPELRRASACWVVAQIAALHSPDDVEIMLLNDPDTDPGSCSSWRWIRWLPHLRGHGEDGPLLRIGTDSTNIDHRLHELHHLIEARRRARRESGYDHQYGPMVVVLDGSQGLLERPQAHGLMELGPPVGVYFICLEEEKNDLPPTGACVGWSGHQLKIQLPGGQERKGVRPDEVRTPWCERLSRTLSSLALRTDDPWDDLPADDPDAEVKATDILRDWQEGGKTPRAVIGTSAQGKVVIDLVQDGPHGIIAGASGAGKTQVLRRLIRSLTVANAPTSLALFLVGGSNICDEFEDLPHTLGAFRCSDAIGVQKAVGALCALLGSRKERMNRSGAQSYEDYCVLRSSDLGREPRVLVVVDDLTYLSEKIPHVAAELVHAARESRSNGVHFVFMTPSPIGVVGGGKAPYCNWRVALRVTDPAESEVVVDVQDAARIPRRRPGLGLLRRRTEEPVLFQVHGLDPGRPGQTRLSPLDWDRLGQPFSLRPLRERDNAQLVAALREAVRCSGPSESPVALTGNLPDRVALSDLPSCDPQDVEDTAVPPVPIGLTSPAGEQEPRVVHWDLAKGDNILVVGSGGSGRSSTLWTLACSVASHCSSRDVHLYAVDSGEGALLPLARLPHTGASVDKSDPQRIARLLGYLKNEIDRRNAILEENGAKDLGELRSGTGQDNKLPYLILLIDHWEGHVKAFAQVGAGLLVDSVVELIQEGRKVGLRLVIATGRGGVVGRLPSLIHDKIVLRMAHTGDYRAVGVPTALVPQEMPPGRCFSFLPEEPRLFGAAIGPEPGHEAGIDPVKRSVARQTQISLVSADQEPGSAVMVLDRIASTADERDIGIPDADRPARMDPLPVSITARAAAELEKAPASEESLPLGVGGDQIAQLAFDPPEHGPILLVTGPRQSGRSTALMYLARGAEQKGWTTVVLAADGSPLHHENGVTFPVHDCRQESGTTALRETMLNAPKKQMIIIDDADQMEDEEILDEVGQWILSGGTTERLLVISFPLEEARGSFGKLLRLRKDGCAVLLLRPSAKDDVKLEGITLQDNVGSFIDQYKFPPGRGLLLTQKSQQWIQIPV